MESSAFSQRSYIANGRSYELMSASPRSIMLCAVAMAAMTLRLSAECVVLERPPLVMTGPICGTAFDQSGGVWDGLEVQLYARGGRVVAKAVTDSRGQFQFGGVPPGDYKINSDVTRESVRWVRLVKAGGKVCRQRIQVLLQIGECLSDADSGAGLRLQIDADPPFDVIVDGDEYDGDFDGRFYFFALEPGTHRVEVRADSYASRTITFSIREFDVRTYRIALRPLPRN